MYIKTLLAGASCLALAACAGIESAPENSTLSQLKAEYGQPTIECKNKLGQQRAVWSQQPLGQYAWGGNVDNDGLISKINPVLTDEHFQVLKDGTWTQEQVRCEFGPPAIIDSVGLPSNRQLVWSYRYKENHVWNSLMFVYFGTDGKQVTKFHPGPDPLKDPDDRIFWGF